MIKSSKKINGSIVNLAQTNLHGAPTNSAAAIKNSQASVTNAVNPADVASALNTQKSTIKLPVLGNSISATTDFSSVSLRTPISLKPSESPNTTQESIDNEVATPASANQKVFSLYTGLSESEPVVIVTSDFMPLFKLGTRSNTGASLSLKEHAKLLNAKTAINFLSQSIDSVNLLQDNKNELTNYIEFENSFVNGLLKNTNSVLTCLDASSYALPVTNNQDSIGSLYEILKKSGYNTSHIVGYTETKLWQQSLLEVKRGLVTHTPNLTAQSFVRKNIKNDEDPFLLSDLSESPEELKKIWMNPYHPALPSISDISKKDTINDSLTSFQEFNRQQYVNLVFANATLVTEEALLDQNNPFGMKAKLAFDKSIFSNKILEPYIASGRDISIIANSIQKEVAYSSFLKNEDNLSHLETKYGYSASPTGDNFRIWDHVIGRFSSKITDFVENPAGLGNSLVSFSQRYIKNGNDVYNVLTFENNIFDNSSITPGSNYYIDSSLNTVDGKSFDTSRLDSLITLTKNAHDSTKTIFDILGYEISPSFLPQQGISEGYTRKNYNNFNLENITEKLSIVADLYKSCIEISSGQFVKLNTNSLVSGFNLTNNETIGVRLASLICKLAVYPTIAYAKVSDRLKTLLFLWLMNVVLSQKNPSIDNNHVISDIKKRISSYVGSVSVKLGNEELEKAMWTARTLFVLSAQSSEFTVEQNVMNDVSREKKAASSSYSNAISGKIFSVDADKGLWKIIVELLKSAYERSDIYSNEYTNYSGLSKLAFLYNYFDLILRVIAVQTPENISGMYSKSRGAQSNLTDTGILIGEVSSQHLNEYFDAAYMINNSAAKYYVVKLKNSIDTLRVEENTTVRQIAFLRKYLLDIGFHLNNFRSYLLNNFEKHLSRVSSLYQNDSTLSQKQKNSLLSLSFSEEQLKLSNYIMSEIKDRLTTTNDSEAKLRLTPAYAGYPIGFSEFLPLNDIEAISYPLLSPYFKSNEFLAEKGNNKKIFSIGIPPRLIRSIHSSVKLKTDNAGAVKQGIVRIKLYKLDRLHPDLVFLPKTYIFEMNRFPTRVLGNWNIQSLSEELNLLNFPSKLMLANGEVELHKNYNTAFPQKYYQLDEEQKYQLYTNHSISFLCEEYMRWFTDCKFDESRYVNFSNVDPGIKFIEDQYGKFLNLIKSNNQTTSTTPSSTVNQVTATFTDPTSGITYGVPADKPKIINNAKSSSTSEKSYSIALDGTLRTYFLNETFMLSPDITKKRISYFKKFDRVFNVLVDPDDFYVDNSMTNSTTLLSLKNLGVLINVGSESKPYYKCRDTNESDTTFDEYFVTVEPYDYVEEYEA